jgi:hypothetical protein
MLATKLREVKEYLKDRVNKFDTDTAAFTNR